MIRNMEIMNFVTQPQVLVTIAVVIMLLWRISYGYKNGLVSELLEIAALAVGFAVLTMSADTVNKFLAHEKLHIIAIVIRLAVVVAIYRVIQGISKGSKGVRKIPLVGKTDGLLGAAFGFVEVYIWIRLLKFVIGYDIEAAITYTINGIAAYF